MAGLPSGCDIHVDDVQDAQQSRQRDRLATREGQAAGGIGIVADAVDQIASTAGIVGDNADPMTGDGGECVALSDARQRCEFASMTNSGRRRPQPRPGSGYGCGTGPRQLVSSRRRPVSVASGGSAGIVMERPVSAANLAAAPAAVAPPPVSSSRR